MSDFFKSLAFAFSGLRQALLLEKNFRLEWLCALAIALVNFLFDFGHENQIIFLLLSFAVLAFELINCGIEKACDNQGLTHSSLIKHAKDYAAASVLLMALVSALIFGLIVLEYWHGLYREMTAEPGPWLAMGLIALLNLPSCLAKLNFFGVLFLALACLVLHGVIIFTQEGDALFLVLSLFFHLGLVASHVKRAS